MSAKHWVIYGNNATSWSAALLLQKQLIEKFSEPKIRITVIAPSRSPEPCPLALHNDVLSFHQLIGIDEQSFLKDTNAGIFLAQAFNRWSKSKPSFLFSAADYGQMHDRIAFFHWLQPAQAQEELTKPENFNLNTLAAQQGLFAPVSPQAPAIYQSLEHGYQVCAKAYSNHLEAIALARGICVHYASTTEVKDAANQICFSSTDSAAHTIHYDYLICAEAQVAQDQQLRDDWQEQNNLLPHATCKISTPDKSSNNLYWSLTKTELGWEQRYDTQQQQYLRSYQITHTKKCADGVDSYGFRTKPWVANRIFLDVNLGGLFIDNLQLNQRSLVNLLKLFPHNTNDSAKSHEFNRLMNQEFQRTLNLHNFIFWSAGLAKTLTQAMQDRLDLFLNQGYLQQLEFESLSDSSWQVLIANLCGAPRSCPVVMTPHQRLHAVPFLTKLASHYQQAATLIPHYPQFKKQLNQNN